MDVPDVRYVKTRDGVFIAFQVFGRGPHDLLFVPGFFSNLIANWDLPGMALFLERLSSFARVIAIDRRGIGLSDRMSPGDLPPLEMQMEDLLAVLDAVHIPRAHLVGIEDGAELCALFAASLPERTISLSTYAFVPWVGRSDDFPFGRTLEEWDTYAEVRGALWARGWGREAAREDYEYAAPSESPDDAAVAALARHLALSASPGSAISVLKQWRESDVRAILPTIHVPTLVLTRKDLPRDHPKIAKWVAEAIPDAQLSEVPGRDLALWAGDIDSLVDEIEAFVTGARPSLAPETVLATVLFTDIVESTELQASLGDRAWKETVLRHHSAVREELAHFRGAEVDTAGDGFYAKFDGPARAVRCALSIANVVKPLGLQIRAGLHTGECQLVDGKPGGIAVSIGARVAAAAGPSEVLVSQTVKDLVAGSGLTFEDAGEHDLKGVPDRWRLYRVVSEPT